MEYKFRYLIRAEWFPREVPGDETVLESRPAGTIEYLTGGCAGFITDPVKDINYAETVGYAPRGY